MSDAIVFTQSELCAALDNGARSIILCDNKFRLPSDRDVTYTAIGQVSVSADFSDLQALGISCVNFVPKLKKRPKTIHISNKAVGVSSLDSGSYADSYRSSYGSGYKLGSFFSSYRLSSSYQNLTNTSYKTSYTTSYITSYRYKYRTSFSGSFTSSYRLSQSFKAGVSSFNLSSFINIFRSYDRILKEISVNGYGIHLI